MRLRSVQAVDPTQGGRGVCWAECGLAQVGVGVVAESCVGVLP